jgi:hypothetical protein
MKSVTIDDVMDWNPCQPNTDEDPTGPYSRAYIAGLFDGRESLSLWDILNLDIPPGDIMWAVLRNTFFSERQLYQMACIFSTRALIGERKAGREPDSNVNTADRNLADAARIARVAAWNAAWDATYAAGSITGDVGGDAVYAARDAERKNQLIIVRIAAGMKYLIWI